MPDKHIGFSESILGLGSFVLDALVKPQTLDALWEAYSSARRTHQFLADHSFENLVLAVDLLYALGAVQEVENTGELVKCG